MELAKEMETQAKEQMKAKAAHGGPIVDSQLWTEKYAPTSIKDICGNKGLVEKLQRWLRDWYFLRWNVLISGLRISRPTSKSQDLMEWDYIVQLLSLDHQELGKRPQHTL